MLSPVQTGAAQLSARCGHRLLAAEGLQEQGKKDAGVQLETLPLGLPGTGQGESWEGKEPLLISEL